MLGGLFDRQRQRQEAGAGAAVSLRYRQAEQPRLREDLEDVLWVDAGLVELGGARCDLFAGDAACSVADQLVRVGKFVVHEGLASRMVVLILAGAAPLPHRLTRGVEVGECVSAQWQGTVIARRF